MLEFRGDDFGSDDAVYALRNYMWDLKEDFRRSRNTFGMWAILNTGAAGLAIYFRNDIGLTHVVILLILETVLITLCFSAWMNLWNTNRNTRILQKELHRRNLG